MQVWWRLATGVAIVCALAFAPTRALASGTLENTLMDDQVLIYSSPGTVVGAMERLASLGVDRVKVSVVWSLVAPDSSSTQRPNFDATNPSAYPWGAWSRYDWIVWLGQIFKIKVYFQLDPPAPRWAIPPGEPQQDGGPGWAPDPTDYEQFVEAVGRRYSGSFVPPNRPSHTPLARVSYWGVWNEPNNPAWLHPWHIGSQLSEPPTYRALVNAAWQGLKASGHSTKTDTILIGETANNGPQTPLQFVRSLYCVDARFRQLKGTAASRVGCPTSGSRAGFVKANPALFDATGFAHHPYSFNEPPNRPYPLRGWITLYNLDSLERTLNSIFSYYGRLPSGGEPMYLTEYGYESDPPNPFVKNSAAQQAAWINEGEYLAWRFPYVRSFNQFELVDSAPNRTEKRGTYAYWNQTFETGLEFLDGQPKPAFAAFRIPIWLPDARHGPSVAIWGQLRPTHAHGKHALLEFERRGSRSFVHLVSLRTSNPEGFFFTRIAIPAAGLVRIAWRDPATRTVYYSRTVAVS